jgi:hypothetical protein
MKIVSAANGFSQRISAANWSLSMTLRCVRLLLDYSNINLC